MDRISEPFNFAQYEIRFRILRAGAQLAKEPEARPFVEEVVRLEEEAAERDGYEPRYFQALGLLKELMAKYYSEPNLYEEAEYDIRKSVELAPGRQDNTFLLAQTLINQGKFDEVKSVADEMLSYAPETVHGRFEHALTLAPYNWNDGNDYIEMLRKVFVEEFPNLEDGRFTLNEVQAAFIRNSYNTYLNYFYRVRDKEGFLMTLNQALKVEKMLDGVGAMQVKEGLISEPVMSAVENIENGIKLFESNGWDAIAPPGQ